MIAFIAAFSLFNLFAGLAGAAKAFQLSTPEGRDRWASLRLYRVALTLAWTLPLVALAATAAAWADWAIGRNEAVPLVLVPIGWLVLFGILFTVVDLAEDGVLGNGLKRR